jgi:hypothetical protein
MTPERRPLAYARGGTNAANPANATPKIVPTTRTSGVM